MLYPRLVAAASLISLLAIASSQAGPKWDISKDSYIQLGVLGQVQASFTEGAVDQHDLYLRRARIILSGQIADGLKFFTETDNDNAGRNGFPASSTDIQDAFVEQRLWTDHYLQGGLILLPFSFENASSAASLLGLDYNLATLQFAETFAWRDYGVVFRGVYKGFAYRVGGFDGYDTDEGTKNPEAGIRGTGHIALSLLGEPENGWFPTQEPLSDKTYLAIGLGGDYQQDATLIEDPDGGPPEVSNNRAWVVDFKSGFPLGPLHTTLNGAWYNWDNSTFDGDTAFLEGGLRLKKFQLTLKVVNQGPEAADDITNFTVGFHHFRHKHNARGGIEFRFGDSANQALLGFQVAL